MWAGIENGYGKNLPVILAIRRAGDASIIRGNMRRAE
jgi:hypothetical protein